MDTSGFSPTRLPSLQQRHGDDTGHDWDSCGEPSHFTPSRSTDEQKAQPPSNQPGDRPFYQVHHGTVADWPCYLPLRSVSNLGLNLLKPTPAGVNRQATIRRPARGYRFRREP